MKRVFLIAVYLVVFSTIGIFFVLKSERDFICSVNEVLNSQENNHITIDWENINTCEIPYYTGFSTVKIITLNSNQLGINEVYIVCEEKNKTCHRYKKLISPK